MKVYEATDHELADAILQRTNFNQAQDFWAVCPADYEPDGVDVEFLRHDVGFLTYRGTDIAFVQMLWKHFQAANEIFDESFDRLEITGTNRCLAERKHRCATHTDTDQGPGTDSRVLSMSLGLSDGFGGGELVLNPGPPRNGRATGQMFRLSKGDLVIFPSATHHRANMVTSGSRLAFVARATNAPSCWVTVDPATGSTWRGVPSTAKDISDVWKRHREQRRKARLRGQS